MVQSNQVVDFWSGGLVAEGNGKILDTAEWNFSIPVSMLNDSAMKKYSGGVELARLGEAALRNTVKKYAGFAGAESAGLVRKATVQYWSTLDSTYQVLVDAATDSGKNLDGWRTVLRQAMWHALEQSCPHETPRQIQAFAQARRFLKIKEQANASSD